MPRVVRPREREQRSRLPEVRRSVDVPMGYRVNSGHTLGLVRGFLLVLELAVMLVMFVMLVVAVAPSSTPFSMVHSLARTQSHYEVLQEPLLAFQAYGFGVGTG